MSSYPLPRRLASTLLATLALSAAARADEAAPDNGTDPTKLSSAAAIQFEHLALRPGGSLGTWKLSYTQPFGDKRDYSLRLRVPVARNTLLGHGRYGLGDTSLQLSHVFGVSRAGGMVAQLELSGDTADRAELGSGQAVAKGTFIYARFLPGGAIVAPALVHSEGLGGHGPRARVRSSTLDFYVVPRLADPQLFITVDPALTRDWTAKREYASLAITFGSSIGRAWGGNAQLFIKPTWFAGGERPARWGMELGYKVIGF